jgi:hypothetical protein
MGVGANAASDELWTNPSDSPMFAHRDTRGDGLSVAELSVFAILQFDIHRLSGPALALG